LFTGIVLLSGAAFAAKPQVDTFTLENGIRVILLYISDSNNVSVFTFLPMGLVYDAPGQSQWSHLVEHLTIRSTVPSSSTEVNGETLPDHIRLDFYGTVNNWKEGVSQHARWLKGVPFTKKSLRAEKRHVNSECDFVAKRLATHKFAMAAWAQGYRHGQGHAAVKGDVNRATLGQIQQYRDKYLFVPNKTVVCIVGGIDAKTLKPFINKNLGTITSEAKMAEQVSLHPGSRKMTWDLNARHLVLTWPIPAFSDTSYPSIMAVGPWLTMKLFIDPEVKKSSGMVLAGADLVTPEGNFFYVSAPIKPDASFDDMQKRIESHLRILSNETSASTEASLLGRQLSYQLTNLPDPRLAKAQATPNVSYAMIEGNIGLQWAMHDFRYGEFRSILAQRLNDVSGEKVRQAAIKYLTAEKCSVFRIEPKAVIMKGD
jgi:predicted Zn-dependent peptidase